MTNIAEIDETLADKSATLQDRVYLQLRSVIMLGQMSPGAKLTMRGLAQDLNLSPTPIREALRRLSSENAIEVQGNRRMRIPLMDATRFEELVAMRIAVESHAAQRALPYVADILIGQMNELDQRMDVQIASGNLDQLILLNQEFHRLLYAANPNQVSLPIVESLWLQLGPFHRQVAEHFGDHYQIDRHKEIIAALQDRDAAALGRAIESDIFDGILRAGRAYLAARG